MAGDELFLKLREINESEKDDVLIKLDSELMRSHSVQNIGSALFNTTYETIGDMNLTILFHEAGKDFISDKPVFRGMRDPDDLERFAEEITDNIRKNIGHHKISESDILTQVLTEGKRRYIPKLPEVNLAEGDKKILPPYKMSSLLFVPLRHNEDIFGYVLFWQLQSKGYFILSPEQVNFLDNIVNMATETLWFNYLEMYSEISRNRFTELISHSNDLVIILKENGLIVDCNNQISKILNFDKSDIIGKNIENLLANKDTDFDFTSEHNDLQYIGFLTDTKQTKYLEISTFVDLDFGQTQLYYLMGREIAPREPIMSKMIQIEKTKSLAILSGGIAHDFNNFLSAIAGNASLLSMYLDNPPSEVSEAIEAIQQIVDKSQSLTKQLLTFSTGGNLVFETIDIEDIIRKAIQFTLSGSDITSSITTSVDKPYIIGDKGMLTQVFTNILINAKEAFVSTFDKKIMIDIHKTDKKYVISIKDNGPGIDQKHLDRIFDPFYSNKATGSGLGLSTAKSIINEHRGHISVESELDRYTVFKITFPIYRGLTRSRDDEEIKHELTQTNIIWIMDDVKSIRESLSKILLNHQQITRTFKEGSELLRSLDTAPQLPELLIVDITNRDGVGGLHLIEELKFRRFSIPVLLISGYAKTFELEELNTHFIVKFLPKPIFEKDLIYAVKNLTE